MTKLLIIISSRTGNTLAVGQAICKAIPGSVIFRTSELPEDLSNFNPILLGFWCDNGQAPADMIDVAKRLHNKKIGCFATMGLNPNDEHAQLWMQKTSQMLAQQGTNNTLGKTYLCRGRINAEFFKSMKDQYETMNSKECNAARKASETHPDRLDLERAAELFRGFFGANW